MSYKFSIITVCFNSEKTIRRTIESVVNQTYKNFEYIVIDGNSTDHTLDIVEEYREQLGNRLVVVSEPDRGIYDAMNKGIQHSSGEIIGFINANDWYEDNALEIIAGQFKGQEFKVVYGMQREYLNGKEKVCYLKRHEFLPTQMIGFPATFISINVYKKFGAYDIQYRSSADLDFLLRIFTSGEVAFKPVYQPISNFGLGGISGTNIGTIETAKIRCKYGIISKMDRNRILLDQNSRIIIKKCLKKIGYIRK